MNLDKLEIEEMEDFMNMYRHLHHELNDREEKIKSIGKEIERLTESVTNLRNIEMGFYEKLTSKYGPGKIDAFEKKWEIIN
jgi:septation ring formation regulator EzrA